MLRIGPGKTRHKPKPLSPTGVLSRSGFETPIPLAETSGDALEVSLRPALPASTVYADGEGRVSHLHPSWRFGPVHFPDRPWDDCPAPRFKLTHYHHIRALDITPPLHRKHLGWSGELSPEPSSRLAGRRVLRQGSA
jgi:hypothetical protein